jgi:hypothetical protein
MAMAFEKREGAFGMGLRHAVERLMELVSPPTAANRKLIVHGREVPIPKQFA